MDVGDGLERLRDGGVECRYVPHLVRSPAPWHDGLAWRELCRMFRTHPSDLIHTHCSKAGALGRWAARRVGIPVVHTPHGHVFYGYFGPFLTQAYVELERHLVGWTRCVVSLTDRETEESLARGIGNPSQYITIPSGVPLTQFRDIPVERGRALRAELGIPETATVFVSIGRLVPIKGFDLLLRAFARLNEGAGRNSCLLLVGSGPEQAAIEALAQQLGVAERIRMLGERADVRPALSAADVFVLASRNEGMGRVFVEAMAAGLPAIGTAVGGIPTLIRDNVTGRLARAEDHVHLAETMAALAADPEGRRRMGRQGADFVYPTYDERTMCERTAAMYENVLAGRNP